MKYLSYVTILLATVASVSAGKKDKKQNQVAETNQDNQNNGQTPAHPEKGNKLDVKKQQVMDKLFGEPNEIQKEMEIQSSDIKKCVDYMKKFLTFTTNYNSVLESHIQQFKKTGDLSDILKAISASNSDKKNLDSNFKTMEKKYSALIANLKNQIANLEDKLKKMEMEYKNKITNPKGVIKDQVDKKSKILIEKAKDFESEISSLSKQVDEISKKMAPFENEKLEGKENQEFGALIQKADELQKLKSSKEAELQKAREGITTYKEFLKIFFASA